VLELKPVLNTVVAWWQGVPARFFPHPPVAVSCMGSVTHHLRHSNTQQPSNRVAAATSLWFSAAHTTRSEWLCLYSHQLASLQAFKAGE
jgi:hypothetical protein